jgi:cytidine deaminase
MTNDLLTAAVEARNRALAPFSGFTVGAALRTAAGSIFTGCNIESASYGLTVCAERVALVKALSEGERGFSEIAIATGSAVITPPCGACRQLLWEYCGDILVTLHSPRGGEKQYRLSQLIPHPFDSGNLNEGKGDI